MPAPRYAIAYTLPPDAPLARFGAGVVGYDSFHRVEVPHLAIAGIAPAILVLATVEPRRHGFQGTFVAPFALAGRGEAEMVDAIDAFTRAHRPIPVGPLAVGERDRFVVLHPVEESARLPEFASACRAAFDPFRAPASAGDPSVSDEPGFHMVLAGPIPNGERAAFVTLMRDAFASFAADQIEIDSISLMKQNDAAGRFHVLTRRRLTGR